MPNRNAETTRIEGELTVAQTALATAQTDINTAEASIDSLKRTGSTVAVGDLATAADRDIVLTIKDEDGTAVARYQHVVVKVTKASGTADSGDPAVINTDLDTSDGLTVVSTKGEAIPDAAIANSKNATLNTITKADGTLTVNIKKTTTNSKFFVHFILPDGTVKTSAIVELNAPA
jgi:hypothetical protein